MPCATGTIPAATAAADPPDEPPGVRSRFHGLRVTTSGVSVVAHASSSGVAVRPTTTAPAARSLATTTWSASEVPRFPATVPDAITVPATGMLSLIAIGTPANGRSHRSGRRASAAASASADSVCTATNARVAQSRAAIRCSAAATTAVGDSSPDRTPRRYRPRFPRRRLRRSAPGRRSSHQYSVGRGHPRGIYRPPSPGGREAVPGVIICHARQRPPRRTRPVRVRGRSSRGVCAGLGAGQSPPKLTAFLDSDRDSVFDVVRIDLQQRWLRAGLGKRITDYCAELPDSNSTTSRPTSYTRNSLSAARQASGSTHRTTCASIRHKPVNSPNCSRSTRAPAPTGWASRPWRPTVRSPPTHGRYRRDRGDLTRTVAADLDGIVDSDVARPPPAARHARRCRGR